MSDAPSVALSVVSKPLFTGLIGSVLVVGGAIIDELLGISMRCIACVERAPPLQQLPLRNECGRLNVRRAPIRGLSLGTRTLAVKHRHGLTICTRQCTQLLVEM